MWIGQCIYNQENFSDFSRSTQSCSGTIISSDTFFMQPMSEKNAFWDNRFLPRNPHPFTLGRKANASTRDENRTGRKKQQTVPERLCPEVQLFSFPNHHFAHYLLLDPISVGSYSTLYRAKDDTSNQLIALKIFKRPPEHPEAHRRFALLQNDLEIISQLNHPGLVRIFQADAFQGYPFVSMELCDGPTLTNLPGNTSSLPIEQIVRHTITPARGLAMAHSRGALHLNLKPSNIIFHAGHYRLLGFGQVHIRGATNEQLSRLTGSNIYQAPELIEQMNPDRRTDLYCLAMIAYRLMTGQPLLEETNYSSNGSLVNQEVSSDAGKHPALLNPSIPKELDSVIARALADDPASRPSDCLEFSDMLEATLRLNMINPAGQSALHEAPDGLTDSSMAMPTGSTNHAISSSSIPYGLVAPVKQTIAHRATQAKDPSLFFKEKVEFKTPLPRGETL